MASFRIRRFAAALMAVTALSAFRPRPEPMPSDLTEALASDAADGEFHRFTLLEAAIIAGGIHDPQNVAKGAAQFQEKVSAAADVREGDPSQVARPTALFDCLHQRFLTGEYRSEYSQIHRTLDDGHFNCVTSTILYRCLCQRAGLDVQVVAAKAHVLCLIPWHPSRYVETTCPEWFQLNDEQKVNRLHESVSLEALRELTDVQLVGKIFYNRGVAALADERFEEASSLLELACRFDRHDLAARDNLMATLNNWALAECDAGRFEASSQLLKHGFSIDETYPPLRTNDLHVHQQWVKYLCQQKEFAKAIEVLDEVLGRRPDADSFRAGRKTVQLRWAESK